MQIAVWMFIAVLLGLWSIAAWGLHQLLGIDPARLAELKPLIERIPHAVLIDRWLPGWQEMLRWAIDAAQPALRWIGSLAPLIVWGFWALGALMLLAAGGLLSMIVALIRRTTARPTPA